MALLHIDGFEHRSVSAAGGPYDLVSGSPTIDTTVYRSGAASLKANSNSAYVSVNIAAGNRSIAGSFYIRHGGSALIAVAIPLVNIPNVSGAAQVMWDGTAGRFALKWGAGAAVPFGPASVSLGVWYRVDFKVDTTTGTATMTASVDGAGEATATATQAAADLTALSLGLHGNPGGGGASLVNFDDVQLTSAASDYPLGAHSVVGLHVTADGTHNIGGAATFENSSNGPITNASTNAYTFLDEAVVSSNLTYITQTGAGAANYVETTFEDLPAGADIPSSVFARHLGRDTSNTGTSVAVTRVVLDDGTAVAPDVRSASDDPGLSWTLFRRVLTAPSGGWTRTNVNGLRCRAGYGNGGQNTLPVFGALLLEVLLTAPPVVGTGSAGVPARLASGSGSVTASGSGAAGVPARLASGTAAVLVSGSGAAGVPARLAQGSGAVTVLGSGSAGVPARLAQGSAGVTVSGSGSAGVPARLSQGSAAAQASGSGSAGIPARLASGAGTLKVVGSGSATLGRLNAQGGGTVSGGATITGSGSAGVPPRLAQGAAVVKVAAAGSGALSALLATGNGTVRVSGQGVANIAPRGSQGSGTARVTGAGSATLAPQSATGHGGTPPATGSGAATLGPLSAQGAARSIAGGTGSATHGPAAAQGAGVVDLTGNGAATLAPETAAGSGVVLVSGGGVLDLAALEAAGAGGVAVEAAGTASLAALVASGAGRHRQVLAYPPAPHWNIDTDEGWGIGPADTRWETST